MYFSIASATPSSLLFATITSANSFIYGAPLSIIIPRPAFCTISLSLMLSPIAIILLAPNAVNPYITHKFFTSISCSFSTDIGLITMYNDI